MHASDSRRSHDEGSPGRQGRVFEVCPVDRPHRFIDDFGHARYSGGYHRHEGIDIFARYGTRVRAPFDGRAKASSNWAGGLAVTLHGREGFVYNAHLSRLGKTGRVQAGDVIGYVGNSGNALGASPHDHFEWHPRGGPAVNPFRFLKSACRSPRAEPAPTDRIQRARAPSRLDPSDVV